ncbi:unnamed protein product [Diplocarpon coronariae]
MKPKAQTLAGQKGASEPEIGELSPTASSLPLAAVTLQRGGRNSLHGFRSPGEVAERVADLGLGVLLVGLARRAQISHHLERLFSTPRPGADGGTLWLHSLFHARASDRAAGPPGLLGAEHSHLF